MGGKASKPGAAQFSYDLFVIGGGPGGLAAAKQVSMAGYRVALAEQEAVGGTCVIRGCIPEKLMFFAAKFAEDSQDATGYGWKVKHRAVQFDWQQFISAQEQETQRLSEVHREALRKAGVELVRGRATFVDAHTVEVCGRHFTADRVLVAVGAVPVKPGEVVGIEHAITAGDVFTLPRQPRHLAVVGGDYIAVKLAGIMRNLGSEVTQVVAEDSVLSTFEKEMADAVTAGAVNRGVTILTETLLKEIRKKTTTGEDDGDAHDALELVLARKGVLEQESNRTVLEVDTVLDGTCRLPNVEGLGLDKAGVEVAEGAIVVDEHSRTTQRNIFAVGDCTASSWLQFTPLAIAQARAFADTEFGGCPRTVRSEHVPAHVSTFPPAASVGLSEARARLEYGNKAVRSFSSTFCPLVYSLADRDEKVLVKLVVETGLDRVVGAHMVGDGAVDIIQCLALALRLGARKKDFDEAIGIHPSVAEEFFSLR